MCLLLAVSSWGQSGTAGNLTWRISSGTLTISGTGEMPNYSAFNTIYSNSPWANYRSSIQSVIISDGVTSIGNYAFLYISDLTSVTIPNSITHIGFSAFTGCYKLRTLNYNAISSSFTSSLPGWTALRTVIIGEEVETIPAYAFRNCSSLTSITVPNSVTSIGSNAFFGCTSLITLNYNAINCIVSLPGWSALTTVIIGEEVKTIPSSAFSNCTSLTSVTIGNSVTDIGNNAFSRCSSLTSITIPNSVTNIGNNAFDGCASLTTLNYNAINCMVSLPGWSALTTVIIGEEVETIPNYAFSDCSSLTSIVIPNSVTYIGNYAFQNCSNLTNITVDSANPNYFSQDGILFNKEKTILIKFPQAKLDSGYIIPNSITSIGNQAFRDCSALVSITIPNSVTSIGWSAFFGCSGLTSITIPNTVTSIESSAFQGCSGLASITIPNTVTSIGNSAFSGCTGLTSITIPNSVTSIGWETFAGCSALVSITIPNTVTSIENSTFSGCSDLTSIIIPNTVTSIGSSAFQGCSSLTSITIPNNVTNIENSTFQNCSSLSSISIHNNITSIGSTAFQGCSSLTSIIIPNSVTNIGSSAFANCSNLTSITLPIKACSSNNVFSSSSIKTMRITDDGEIKTNLLSNLALDTLIVGNAKPLGKLNQILSVSNLKYFSMTNKETTSLPANLLEDCESLTDLTIPFIGTIPRASGGGALLGSMFGTTANDNMRAVTQYYEEGQSATFYMPRNLEKLTITAAPRLEFGALYNCSSLKELTIGSSVTGVAEKALYGCSGLEHIYAQRALPPAAYSSSFEGIGLFSATLHVPADSKKFYEIATGWKDFFTIQEEAPIKINAIRVPLNGGMIIGLEEYERNMPASLEAIAHADYTFQCWMEGEEVISTSSVYSFMAMESRNIYAVFVPKENADETITITPQPTSAAIVWDVVDDAQNYVLVIYSDEAKTQELYRVELDVNGNPVMRSSSLNHTVPNLSPETDYYYTLTSYNANNQAVTISSGDFSTPLVSSIATIETVLVRVYPNPVKDILYINSNAVVESVMIYDTVGKLIIKQTNTTGGIDVSGLRNGTYIIKIQTNTNITTQKIVKK